MLVALDPGIRGCGLALFDHMGYLHAASYVKNPVKKGDDLDAVLGMVNAVVVQCLRPLLPDYIAERMQIHRQGKRKGDPNDLVPLGGIATGVAMELHAHTARWVYPREWKGNIPKPEPGEPLGEYLIYQRVMDRLSESERSTIQYHGALSHNVIDAIGIGLFQLGRFKNKRVIAR